MPPHNSHLGSTSPAITRANAEDDVHVGVSLTPEALEKIDAFAKFENYKKKSTVNKPIPMWNEGKGEFVRKGQVGDWVNMFSPELTSEYDSWIREELARLDITDPQIVGYFQLQE